MEKNDKKWLNVGLGMVFVLCILAIGYKLGYRFENNFMIGKVGVVSIEIRLPQTNIFIDESKKIVTSKENEIIKFTLSPRNHSVIVSHDGAFPWKKDFVVPSGGNLTLSPIIVNQNASGLLVAKDDPEYWKIRNQIVSDKLPTENSPRVGVDNLTTTWVKDKAVMAKVKDKVYNVIEPETKIKNLYFYKDRLDSVIFSTNNGVYVIEIDKLGTQNFIPIYKGQNPYFIKGDSNYIYVLDGESLMQIVI